MILAVVISACLFVGLLTIHYRAVKAAIGWGQGRGTLAFAAILLAFLALHLFEVGLYAVGYEAARGLGLGDFREADGARFMDVYYFSLATYSTLGLGKVMPMGHLAFIAGVEAFAGFLAITISATGLFSLTKPD